MRNIRTIAKEFHLDAIAWKCKQTGLSYGQLISSYDSSEIQKIYEEFMEVVIERKQKNSAASNRDKAASAE